MLKLLSDRMNDSVVKPVNLCTISSVLLQQVNDQSCRSAVGSFAEVGEVSGDLTTAPDGGGEEGCFSFGFNDRLIFWDKRQPESHLAKSALSARTERERQTTAIKRTPQGGGGGLGKGGRAVWFREGGKLEHKHHF